MSATLSPVSTHLFVLLCDSNASSTGLQLMLVHLLEHVTVLHTEGETERFLKIVSLVL